MDSPTHEDSGSVFDRSVSRTRHGAPVARALENRRAFGEVMAGSMRIVVAKPGLDGHDRGAKVVARALRDAGHEVIYTGLRRTPAQIVATVRDEDARFLGLSSLSGAHGHLFPTICQLLRDEGLGDVVVFGGGIIPDADRPALHDAGMRAIFGPGTSTEAISAFVAEASGRNDAGVGAEGGWIWEA